MADLYAENAVSSSFIVFYKPYRPAVEQKNTIK